MSVAVQHMSQEDKLSFSVTLRNISDIDADRLHTTDQKVAAIKTAPQIKKCAEAMIIPWPALQY